MKLIKATSFQSLFDKYRDFIYDRPGVIINKIFIDSKGLLSALILDDNNSKKNLMFETSFFRLEDNNADVSYIITGLEIVSYKGIDYAWGQVASIFNRYEITNSKDFVYSADGIGTLMGLMGNTSFVYADIENPGEGGVLPLKFFDYTSSNNIFIWGGVSPSVEAFITRISYEGMPNEEAVMDVNNYMQIDRGIITVNGFSLRDHVFPENAFKGSIISYFRSDVRQLADKQFENCHRLKWVDLPAAEGLGEAVFRGCADLMYTNLPSLTYLSNSMFEGCEIIRRIDLPSLGEGADTDVFKNCKSLEQLNVPLFSSFRVSPESFNGIKSNTITITHPKDVDMDNLNKVVNKLKRNNQVILKSI